MVATVGQAKKVMRVLIAAGVEVTNWFKDGAGDSIKIETIHNGHKFVVAVESPNDLPVMDPDYNWTYGHANIVDAIRQMERYNG